MKDFLIQALKDLEPLTGIRQLYFLEQDHPDGKRKIEILISGILQVCKQFEYIPETAQQKIIRDQMVKDQDFDAFNSRTVWKWFNGQKDLFWEKSQRTEHIDGPIEPLSEETLKMIAEFQKDLARQMTADKHRPMFAERLRAEMDKIATEDKVRSGIKMPNSEEGLKHLEFRQKMDKAVRDRGLDKAGLHELKLFTVEGQQVRARNHEEAQEIYLEVYL